jgi:HPt (histidine-containing phosphotransfer) domain-containing protein
MSVTELAASESVDIEGLDIVDEAHLASFTEGDSELEQELGDLFANTSRGYLKRMKEALREERPWSAEAHALKGAGANLGARRVAALARKAEFAPPSAEQVDALEQAIRDVEQFFSNRPS